MEIKLEGIHNNPFQKRQVYRDVEGLGRTIAMDGLQQIPKARACPNGDGVQLKFGHRRREAFRWLKANWKKEGLPDRYDGYSFMPLDIEDLTDEQMFRGVTVENSQREDLSPIEKMEEMKAWIAFGYDSKQIAEMYPGMSDSTVRGLLYFDKLPPEVKDALHTGEITQGTARVVNTLQKLVRPEVVKEIVLDIVKGETIGQTPEAYIIDEIDAKDTVVELWSDGRSGKPRAKDEWLLDMKNFPNHLLPVITPEDLQGALGFDAGDKVLDQISDALRKYHNANKDDPTYANMPIAEVNGASSERIEKIKHLINPSACNTCPWYGKIQKIHYCGIRECYERKERAWHRHLMHEASKKLNIPIYDPKVDGSMIVLQDTYSNRAHAALFAQKNKDLRLAFMEDIDRKKYQSGYNGIPAGTVVCVVGNALKILEEKKEEVREKKNEANAEQEKQEQRRKLEIARRDASQKFAYEYAPPIFAIAFKDMDHIPAMCALLDVSLDKKDTKKSEVLSALRARMARKALGNLNGLNWQLYEKGPVATAKYLQGVATTWGVKLPADFLETAQKCDPVSVETKAKKK